VTIDIDTNAWLHALAGGMLIGLSATLMLWLNGRIAGVSGVLGGLVFDRPRGETLWRALFLVGLAAGALLWSRLSGSGAPAGLPTWPLAIVAGLLVGFGTRLGSGCTSGHGICGLARFSKRSFAATMIFMAFGFLTVFIVRHLWSVA
jgi:uncharacterized membrane protein YedE/YeeE